MPWSVAVRGESSRFNSQVSLDQPFADRDLEDALHPAQRP